MDDPSVPTRRRLGDAADEMLSAYVDWREQCVAEREAYDAWATAEQVETAARFAAFLAALDGEDHLSRRYMATVLDVARLVVDTCAIDPRDAGRDSASRTSV